MNRHYIAWVVLVSLVLVVSACQLIAETPFEDKGDKLDKANGEQVYLEYCAECHQVDGSGWSTLYPRLAGNPIVTLHDPEPIILTVKYGQGSMMPFRDKLTPVEIAAVLTYIRNAWGNKADQVLPRYIQ